MGSIHRTSQKDVTIKALTAAVEQNGQNIADLQQSIARVERVVADMAETLRASTLDRRSGIPFHLSELDERLDAIEQILQQVLRPMAADAESTVVFTGQLVDLYKQVRGEVETIRNAIGADPAPLAYKRNREAA